MYTQMASIFSNIDKQILKTPETNIVPPDDHLCHTDYENGKSTSVFDTSDGSTDGTFVTLWDENVALHGDVMLPLQNTPDNP